MEDNSTDVYSAHQNLFVTGIDSTGKATLLPDQVLESDNYGGNYNSSSKQYVFIITRYMQGLMTGFSHGSDYNYGLYLIGGGRAINGNRTILKGNTIKLKLYYTPVVQW